MIDRLFFLPMDTPALPGTAAVVPRGVGDPPRRRRDSSFLAVKWCGPTWILFLCSTSLRRGAAPDAAPWPAVAHGRLILHAVPELASPLLDRDGGALQSIDPVRLCVEWVLLWMESLNGVWDVLRLYIEVLPH